jgi:antitoxin (DNA-binding transcriptional repressor) of toxin-antitoxin stability system
MDVQRKQLNQLVDKLVDYHYPVTMKIIEVGAFEAKTHFSQLLDEVEGGTIVKISRRGRPVAILKQDDAVSREASLRTLQVLRNFCRHKSTLAEIEELRDRGRER